MKKNENNKKNEEENNENHILSVKTWLYGLSNGATYGLSKQSPGLSFGKGTPDVCDQKHRLGVVNIAGLTGHVKNGKNEDI